MEREGSEDSRTAATGTARAARKRATRDRILAAALREFAAAGFDGASTSTVAVEAGVANGTVFLHFGTKPRLYGAVAGHAADAFHAAVSPLARTPGTSFLAVVEAHEAFLHRHPDIAGLLCSMQRVHPCAAVRDGARRLDARLVGVWRDWIAARPARRPADADDLARLAAAAVSGLLAAQHVDRERDARAALARFATFVENATAVERNAPSSPPEGRGPPPTPPGAYRTGEAVPTGWAGVPRRAVPGG